jgi:hypothetical protein
MPWKVVGVLLHLASYFFSNLLSFCILSHPITLRKNLGSNLSLSKPYLLTFYPIYSYLYINLQTTNYSFALACVTGHPPV